MMTGVENKKNPIGYIFIWYVTLLCDFQENVADEKWWIFHSVDIISILSVWAISNSSLYRGYQLFHVACIHSRVVKGKKILSSAHRALSSGTWKKILNVMSIWSICLMFYEYGSSQSSIEHVQRAFFRLFFLYDKNSYHESAQECPLYLSKVFSMKNILHEKRKNGKKYRLCQVNFMTFISGVFFTVLYKKCG